MPVEISISSNGVSGIFILREYEVRANFEGNDREMRNPSPDLLSTLLDEFFGSMKRQIMEKTFPPEDGE